MTDKKYTIPDFLKKIHDEKVYTKWLTGKANAHFKRDTKRWNIKATREDYKKAIHQAVVDSNGLDFYTGKELDWNLIGSYDNKKSKEEGGKYKEKFANLPSVDHVYRKNEKMKFVICSWKVNDAKNDLSYKDFLDLCREIVEFAEKKSNK